jgi:hypothetical protein
VEIRSGEKVGGGSLLLVVHCRRPMEVGARRAAEQGCHGHGCLAAQRRDVGAASSTLCASRETQERPPHAGGRRMRLLGVAAASEQGWRRRRSVGGRAGAGGGVGAGSASERGRRGVEAGARRFCFSGGFAWSD